MAKKHRISIKGEDSPAQQVLVKTSMIAQPEPLILVARAKVPSEFSRFHVPIIGAGR